MSKSNATNPKINAKSMRAILSLGLVILLSAVGVGFYFAYQQVNNLAEQTAIKQTEADSIDRKITYLQGLKKELDKQSMNITKAQRIVAETKDYQYQNQIISDLLRIAMISKVDIQSYTFNNESATGASGETTAATQPAQIPSDMSSQPTINSTEVSIKLGDSIEFKNYLTFISLIERNITRMQISDVSITRNEENPNLINSQEINIKVYTR